MNKLFVIRFLLPGHPEYCLSTWYGWSEADAQEKIRKNPEWEFTVSENNEIHKIWEAR